MTDTIYQQLREHLHHLKLTAVADQLAPAHGLARTPGRSPTRERAGSPKG